MTRTIEQLLVEYRACLLRKPEQRRAWLDGLAPVEGANLFSMIHNVERKSVAAEEIYAALESLNWIDYTRRMEKIARHKGIQIPQ